MWVDAIQTRQRGRKLPQERLEAMIPRRGRLWISVMRGWADDGERRPLTASLLGARDGEMLIWQLDKVRVKIRDGQILVLGYEDHSFSAKAPKLVPQVWWCDPVRAPLDDVEERAKARFPPTAAKINARPFFSGREPRRHSERHPMNYDDTHVTQAQLATVQANDFDMAVMADDSGKQPWYLYSTPRDGRPYISRPTWRRLVVHVADIAAPGLEQRLLDALGVKLMDVPF